MQFSAETILNKTALDIMASSKEMQSLNFPQPEAWQLVGYKFSKSWYWCGLLPAKHFRIHLIKRDVASEKPEMPNTLTQMCFNLDVEVLLFVLNT